MISIRQPADLLIHSKYVDLQSPYYHCRSRNQIMLSRFFLLVASKYIGCCDV